MKRGIDEVIQLHKMQEVERLREDITKKCRQIVDLLTVKDEQVAFTPPEFYRVTKRGLEKF